MVKIDRSFRNDIEDDPSDAAIVAAIVAMTRTLGIEVVAGGRDPPQAQHLVALGCNVMQSYLYFASRVGRRLRGLAARRPAQARGLNFRCSSAPGWRASRAAPRACSDSATSA